MRRRPRSCAREAASHATPAKTHRGWATRPDAHPVLTQPFRPHPAQQPPDGLWRIWLFMGGRGAGKTRAGAEWVRAEIAAGRARRIALVGPTLNDVREVMIEGPSGLRSIAPDEERPVYIVSRRRLVWPDGLAEAFAFSAEDPDSLRGPQFDLAWCDEAGAWKRDVATWDMLRFGMRLGQAPRTLVTTTPRASPLVRRLVGYCETGLAVMTRAASRENAGNLAPGFVDELEAMYRGTVLARQELDGEFVEDRPGALFRRDWIEAARLPEGGAPALERVVVAVDPPATTGAGSSACGTRGGGRLHP
jgi:phage terminase large subunit-like protein